MDYEWISGRGTGKPKPDPRKEGEFLPRTEKHGPPPCHSCPKKGPHNEHLYQLSERNLQAVIHYQNHKATFGRGLSEAEATDSIVQRNFAILDRVFAEADRERLSDAISRSLLPRVR